MNFLLFCFLQILRVIKIGSLVIMSHSLNLAVTVIHRGLSSIIRGVAKYYCSSVSPFSSKLLGLSFVYRLIGLSMRNDLFCVGKIGVGVPASFIFLV